MTRECFEEMLKEEPFNKDVFKYYEEEHTPEIRGKIALRNEKLVHFVIGKFFSHKDGLDSLYEDYYQEGFIGLLKAVDRFDYKSGNMFSTYATFWIRENINMFIKSRERTVSVPKHFYSKKTQIAKAEDKLREKGLKITVQNLVDATGLSEKNVMDTQMIFRPTVSLNEMVKYDSADAPRDELVDSIASDKDTAEDAIKLTEKEKLMEIIDDRLSEIEKNVIFMRFGMDGSGTMTLAAISKKMGFTKQYINYLQKNAITKLKSCMAYEDFADLMEG